MLQQHGYGRQLRGAPVCPRQQDPADDHRQRKVPHLCCKSHDMTGSGLCTESFSFYTMK